MTAFLERVPMGRVTAAAATEVHPGRALLTALTAVLYLIGWAPTRLVRVLWLSLLWVVAAVKVGAVDAWSGPVEDHG